MSVTEAAPYVGARVKRREDAALLTGRGTYVDNLSPAGMVWVAIVRSPYAHARIRSVDVAAAQASDGVVAAFTGADLADDWKAGLPCAWPVTEDMKNPPHYPLTDTARYQGDGVAVVIAETRAQAKDAAELVEVDYEPLDAIVDVASALSDGATLAHPDLGTNECYVWTLDTDATGQKLEDAEVVVTRTYYQPRLIPNAMEPRTVLAVPGPTGDLTLYAATQDIPGDSYVGPGGFQEGRGNPKLVGCSDAAQDTQVAQRLWELSEELTGVSFPLANGVPA